MIGAKIEQKVVGDGNKSCKKNIKFVPWTFNTFVKKMIGIGRRNNFWRSHLIRCVAIAWCFSNESSSSLKVLRNTHHDERESWRGREREERFSTREEEKKKKKGRVEGGVERKFREMCFSSLKILSFFLLGERKLFSLSPTLMIHSLTWIPLKRQPTNRE